MSEAEKNKQQQNKSKNIKQKDDSKPPKEVGGRKGGLDPVRYGDWEKNGRCVDF